MSVTQGWNIYFTLFKTKLILSYLLYIGYKIQIILFENFLAMAELHKRPRSALCTASFLSTTLWLVVEKIGRLKSLKILNVGL